MLRALRVAIAFLTRFPTGIGEVDGRDLGRALGYFPLVGVALGAVLVGIVWMAYGWFSTGLLSVLLVAVLALLTGGLHLDGFADVFDALGGGRGDRERMLAIMHDSHCGAHGAAALSLLLLAKVLAVHSVLESNELGWLLCFPVVARWAVVPLVVLFPYAREGGLGSSFKDHAGAVQLVVATDFVWPTLFWLGPAALKPLGFSWAVVLLFALYLNRKLGGLTGDAYGAGIEIAELVFLVAAQAM